MGSRPARTGRAGEAGAARLAALVGPASARGVAVGDLAEALLATAAAAVVSAKPESAMSMLDGGAGGFDTLVLDGIPRNVRQAEILRETLDVVAVFYLKSSNEKNLIQRIQRRAIREHRLDDANLSVIRERMKTYERETQPLLDFYGRKIVHQIKSDQTPAKVLADILRLAVKN